MKRNYFSTLLRSGYTPVWVLLGVMVFELIAVSMVVNVVSSSTSLSDLDRSLWIDGVRSPRENPANPIPGYGPRGAPCFQS